MRPIKSAFCFLLIIFLLSCCTGEKADSDCQITVLFSLSGLGDMGYNDEILRGAQTIKKERSDVKLQYFTPSSLEDAEQIFREWLQQCGKGGRNLFVFASSDYETVAKKCLAEVSSINKNDILLFESVNAENLPLNHFQISLYGASYLAGITAAATPAEFARTVLGNSQDLPIKYAAEGFEAGFISGGKTKPEIVNLADDWSGFAKADEVYLKMKEWVQKSSFIFPVAGGSNNGVYRYMREFSSGLFTAGMDVDKSALCSQIVGSVVKRIDKLIINYLNQWIDTGNFPSTIHYGLESGYSDWVLSPDYQEAFGSIVESARQTAITKEQEYEETTL